MKRLFVDLKEDHKGEVVGTVKFPADGTFVLEALALAVVEFAKANDMSPSDVATDLSAVVKLHQ